MNLSKLSATRPNSIKIRPLISGRIFRLDMPIAWRLTLGFLFAALISTLVAGYISLQHTQTISEEASFYQNLLQVNSDLTTGDRFLQLMDNKIHQTLADAVIPTTAPSTVTADIANVQSLATRYDNALKTYTKTNLLEQHPDQVAFLAGAGRTGLVERQRTLADSAVRTWRLTQSVQAQVTQGLEDGLIAQAQLLERSQAEPTGSDTFSALRALIRFNGSLATSVGQAAASEQSNQLASAIIAALIAFLSIGIIGWFISNTLIRRLQRLRKVTQEVEQGRLSTRVVVSGRDEIAEVSNSVNVMLDTIVNLLDETRRQHDALTNAARLLFSDMHVVNGGDFQVRSAINNDPIGMLANAFNFTVGRFRRFVLRTQTSIEQLEMISQRELRQSSAFLSLVHIHTSGSPDHSLLQSHAPGRSASLAAQMEHTRAQIQQFSQSIADQRIRSFLSLTEHAHTEAMRLGDLVTAATNAPTAKMIRELPLIQLQEGRLLEALVHLNTDAKGLQKSMLKELSELNMALNQICSKVRLENMESISPPPDYEGDFVRQAGGFAQEVAALGQKLVGVTQEMRTSVAPFQLDVKRATSLHSTGPEAANGHNFSKRASMRSGNFPK